MLEGCHLVSARVDGGDGVFDTVPASVEAVHKSGSFPCRGAAVTHGTGGHVAATTPPFTSRYP